MLKTAGADAAWRAYGVDVTEGWREDGFVLAFADAAAGRRRVAAAARAFDQGAIYEYTLTQGAVARRTLGVGLAMDETTFMRRMPYDKHSMPRPLIRVTLGARLHPTAGCRLVRPANRTNTTACSRRRRWNPAGRHHFRGVADPADDAHTGAAGGRRQTVMNLDTRPSANFDLHRHARQEEPECSARLTRRAAPGP